MKKAIIGIIFWLFVLGCANSQTNEQPNSMQTKENNMKNDTTVADYATDPNIEVHVKEFLKTLNVPVANPHTPTPAEARAGLTQLQSSVRINLSGIEVKERSITQDGFTVGIHIVRPSGKPGKLPVFMFFHGGGWVTGDFPTHERLVRDLVVYSGAAAVFVDYTPSPEAQYPVAVNQAYAATKWVAAHGSEIDVDGSRLAVAGNSVGGNMTAVVALMAKDKQGPPLRFQLLFWPVTNASFETESYHKYATQRFLTRDAMKWFWDNYAPDTNKRNEIYASPLRSGLDQLKGLPPALVQVAENDVLRDEGEAYARKMDLAGVPVSLIRCQGMIHDYGMLNPLADIPEVQSVLRYAAGELARALK